MSGAVEWRITVEYDTYDQAKQAAEPGSTCSRCAGARLADDYPELPDEGEAGLRYGSGEGEASGGDDGTA